MISDLDKAGYQEFLTRMMPYASDEKEVYDLFQMLLEEDYSGFVKGLDFSTAKDRACFWSGDKKRITKIAQIMGWQTFNSTPGGKVLDEWEWLNVKFPWQNNFGTGNKYDPMKLWNAASKEFADHVFGETTYFFEDYEGVTWQNCEGPIVHERIASGAITSLRVLTKDNLKKEIRERFYPACDEEHSQSYINFIQQISAPELKGHAPDFADALYDHEKLELQNTIFERFDQGDLGVINAIITLDSSKAYMLIKNKLEKLHEPSYARVLYLAALYDISLNESYLAEIRKLNTKGDWVLSNKIHRILKDRETK